MVTHRRPAEQIVVDVGIAFQAEFHVGLGDAADAVAEFLDDQFRGIGVERLGQGRHHAHFHQRLDDLGGPGGHAVGQFLHGDGLRQDDVAHDLHLIRTEAVQFGLATLTLALAADRGQRADLFVLAFDRGLHVDAAARRRSLVPPLGATTGGLRAGAPPGPVRRTGRPSSSSSGRRARSRRFRWPRPVWRGRRRASGGGAALATGAGAAGCGDGAGVGAAWAGSADGSSCGSSGVAGALAAAAAAAAASAARRASASTFSRAACSSARRASSSAALRASASRRRASSAAERIEIFSCSRRSASRLAASRFCSSSARCRAASSVAVSARPAPGGRRPGATVIRGAGAAPAGGGGGAPAAAEGLRATGARDLRTSTSTTFDRPWLKLCRTEPTERSVPIPNALPDAERAVPCRRPDRCFRSCLSLAPVHRSPGRFPVPWPSRTPRPLRTRSLTRPACPLPRRATLPICPAQPRRAPHSLDRTRVLGLARKRIDNCHIRRDAGQEARTLRLTTIRRLQDQLVVPVLSASRAFS